MDRKALVDLSQDPEVQRQANAKVDWMLAEIAAGRMVPPEPFRMMSKKHGLAHRAAFDERSAKGQRKLLKRFILEQMVQDLRARGKVQHDPT